MHQLAVTRRKDLNMGQVHGQNARDIALYRAWVAGRSQVELGAEYGISHQAVSQAIARVRDAFPAPEKALEVRRAVDLADELLAVYIPKALDGNTAASREVRGYKMLQARWLGIGQREVQVQGQVEHLHSWVPGPSPAEVLDDWRRRGILHGEITRADP